MILKRLLPFCLLLKLLNYLINKIINNEINVYLPDVFYQFSPSERMIVLKAIKEKRINTNVCELYVKLTDSEKTYLGGNLYDFN